MLKVLYVTLSTFLYTTQIFATDTLQVKNHDAIVKAIKINYSVNVDGKLDEECWLNGYGFENFIQKEPVQGINPTEKTIMKIAYDDNSFYLAARMFDSSPDSIVTRLARRDEWIDSDHITLYLDPYNDGRTGYFFCVNAGGTMIDGILYNDDWDDESWDGVWESKVIKDDHGWTAEMRIPFSQMRFNNIEQGKWGINFRRCISRKNERDFLVFVPMNESGFVSHFASLEGITGLDPGGKIEILPYVNTRAEYLQYKDGDPFNSGSNYVPRFGGDLKMGIGSSLNLNGTINPDFGQVEIDPAVINLSDVETFFEEKRPFFIEGSSIFDFGTGGARNYWGFNWSSADFFYTRRIGRTPQGSTPDDADYVDYPDGTDILGATKLTGKIGDSWNVGTIQNITTREFARISIDGKQSELEVEPLTYYGVFRTQKEFDEGRQALGFMSTLTYRNFNEERLRDEINDDAQSFGIDGWTFLDSSKTWVFTGWTGVSRIAGNTQRIIDVQNSSRHYFQRPDADHVEVDSNLTSLSGYAGRFYLNKQKGNVFFNSAFGFITPGFDVNDAGFMSRTDLINMHIGGGYSWTDPTDFFRYNEVGGAVFRNYDFGGNITWHGVFIFGHMQFLNYYWVDWDVAYNPESYNNTRTRGGPLTKNPPGYQLDLSVGSDSRKDWVVSIGGYTYQSEHNREFYLNTTIELRPASNISVILSPEFTRESIKSQWVDGIDDITADRTYGRRYVFAEFDQNTLSASIRLNWTFTPKLSLQLYIQPLISSGDYYNFKELKQPSTYDFIVYGTEGSTIDEETGTVDPDGNGPAQSFVIDNSDFNFTSLRGNAVLRWEYLPGSVIYFVWNHTRSHSKETGDFQFRESVDQVFLTEPDNIFMIKATYWLNF